MGRKMRRRLKGGEEKKDVGRNMSVSMIRRGGGGAEGGGG